LPVSVSKFKQQKTRQLCDSGFDILVAGARARFDLLFNAYDISDVLNKKAM